MTDELTPEERRWLEQVAEEVPPPAELRASVVAGLAAAGAFKRRPPARFHRYRTFAAAAGIALAFLVGGLVGRATAGGPNGAPAPPAAPAGEQFLLLLYEDAAYDAAGRSTDQLVAEYAAWAGQLAAEGRLVAAEKLGEEEGRVVPAGATPAPVATGVLTGFFIVRAPGYAEAARVAQASPHTGYGGRVVVRRIEGT